MILCRPSLDPLLTSLPPCCQASGGLPASVPLTPLASDSGAHSSDGAAATDSSAAHPHHHHHHHHPHSIPDASNPLGPVVEDVLASASTPPRAIRQLDPGESPRDATPLLSNTRPAGQQHSHLAGQEEGGEEGAQEEEDEEELKEGKEVH